MKTHSETIMQSLIILVAAVALGAAGCSKDESSTAPEVGESSSGSEVQESGAVAENTAEGAEEKDIVDTAVGAGSFETLVAAVKAADLVDTLKGPGPFTVFAPTDEAFAALPEGTLEDLLKPENKDKLRAILTYHVVAGEVSSEAASSLDSAKTVEGSELAIKAEGSTVQVGGADVVTPNIRCSNGVIHVINKVLLPEKS